MEMREMLVVDVVDVICRTKRDARVLIFVFLKTKARERWLIAATTFMHSAMFSFILFFNIIDRGVNLIIFKLLNANQTENK